MAITRNIVVGISDVHNEPDAILFRSTENGEDINIQVVAAKFAVKIDDVNKAIEIVKDFVGKREPIEITKESMPSIIYGEEN